MIPIFVFEFISAPFNDLSLMFSSSFFDNGYSPLSLIPNEKVSGAQLFCASAGVTGWHSLFFHIASLEPRQLRWATQ
jgi:hypothetical protein